MAKKRIVVTKDVKRDPKTDKRVGEKQVLKKRLHGGTKERNVTYEGGKKTIEKVRKDEDGKKVKVVVKVKKQTPNTSMKKRGAIKPTELVSRDVKKGKAAETYVSKQDKAKAGEAKQAGKSAAKAAKTGLKGRINPYDAPKNMPRLMRKQTVTKRN
jgi:hypothetical protein